MALGPPFFPALADQGQRESEGDHHHHGSGRESASRSPSQSRASVLSSPSSSSSLDLDYALYASNVPTHGRTGGIELRGVLPSRVGYVLCLDRRLRERLVGGLARDLNAFANDDFDRNKENSHGRNRQSSIVNRACVAGAFEAGGVRLRLCIPSADRSESA
jgi:hypothetical protein